MENGDTDERENIVKILVRTVISNVDRDSKGNIEVKYIADKKLEAEWQEIKSANLEVKSHFQFALHLLIAPRVELKQLHFKE